MSDKQVYKYHNQYHDISICISYILITNSNYHYNEEVIH